MSGVRRGFALRVLGAALAAGTAWWLLRPEAPPAPAPRPQGPKAAAEPAGAPPAPPPTGPEPSQPMPARSGKGPAPTEPLARAPDFATVRGFLSQALEEHFSRHKLSDRELDELARSVLALRRARQRLARLEREPERAAELARAREEVGRAVARFEELLDMSPAEFTETLAREAGGGVSDPEDRDAVPPGTFLEDLPPPEAP